MEELIEKTLKGLLIEEEDKLLILTSNPRFNSSEKNVRSIMGRCLNPGNQNMANLILDLPRIWGVYDRVRGIALSHESFQFMFKYEEDLERILKMGVWTHEDWVLTLERWSPFQTEDYLMILPIWIRLCNLPVNHYTIDTISEIAETVGQVIELAYDPLKPQRQDYIRVKVLFNVSKPLKNTKSVQLPNGKIISVGIEYERVRKICFHCQRLTHDKVNCPWNPLNRQATATEGILKEKLPNSIIDIVSSPQDPLCGVLSEEQVGVDSNTGRKKIANEVLDEMRQYLQVQDVTEKKAREERIKKSIRDLEGDVVAQKTMLSLEKDSVITKDYNKEKGLMYNFEEKGRAEKCQEKFMGSTFKASERLNQEWAEIDDRRHQESTRKSWMEGTSFKEGQSEASSSSLKTKRKYVRKRPPKGLRFSSDPRGNDLSEENHWMKGARTETKAKRKSTEGENRSVKITKQFRKEGDLGDPPRPQ